jgi:branched-subunit amino acid ABC-type transport system permease component
MILISILIDGVLLGLIYALFAVGLTVALGVMRVFNVAYGAISAFAVMEAGIRVPGAPYLAVVLAAMLAGAGISVAVELVAVTPVQGRFEGADHRAATTLLTTLGAWLILSGVNTILPSRGAARSSALTGVITLGDLRIQTGYLASAAIVIAAVLVVHLVIVRTQLGRSLRAIAANVQMAQLVGINVRLYSALSAAIAGAFAGLAGILFATIFAGFDAGGQFLLRGFEIVVVAGLGSVLGTLPGAVALGVTENLLSYFGASSWSTTGGAIMLALVLLVRPRGLFGRRDPHQTWEV